MRSTSWRATEDLRRLPLAMRKANLTRLLARRVDGHACLMGLEGMVSKHRESLYRGGRFRHWIKVKNRQPPAFSRVLDQFG
jgi:ATP-dependent DNA ligase